MGRARVAEDRSGPEGAGTELHPSLEPADSLLLDQRVDGVLYYRLVLHNLEDRPSGPEAIRDLRI